MKPSQKLAVVMAVFVLAALLFYWASGEQLFYTVKNKDSVTAKTAAVLTEGTTVSFDFKADTDYSDSISPLVSTDAQTVSGDFVVRLTDSEGKVLAEKSLAAKELPEYAYDAFVWDEPVPLQRGETYTVLFRSENAKKDTGVTLWYGDSVSTGRFTIKSADVGAFTVNGETVNGKICYRMSGRDSLWIGRAYWPIALALGVLILLYGLHTLKCLSTGRSNGLLYYRDLYRRYRFLIHQLVARDFKRKYKRSVLGVFWSFLNPLLTMFVQYIIFNTLFKSSIEHFIVYLLSAIVLYNFFSEAVNMCLTSITDNANLINKVYMPKVIYPLSRTISSVVNLLIALIPLLGATVISGLPLTKAVLLLPIDLCLLFLFSLGLGMFLATSMVYFRDTLFLWGVVSVLWAYLTPSFYPITIVPAALLPIFKMNPLYQFITFARTILIDGVAPSPLNYLGCVISAFAMLAIGWAVFKKNQRKFILHL